MRRLLVLVAVLALAACSDFGSPRRLIINVQVVPATAAVGDTVSVIATAEGGSLFGVQVSYGDGEAESFNTGGAKTVQVTFRHAYQSAGTFDVQATASDATGGSRSATVSVTIQ